MLKRAKSTKITCFADIAKRRFMIYHISSISRPPACPFQGTALHRLSHRIASAIAPRCVLDFLGFLGFLEVLDHLALLDYLAF